MDIITGTMDANKRKVMEIMVKRTIKNLESNRMKAVYAPTGADALKIVKAMVPPSATTAIGGSMTLEDIGVTDYLRKETRFSDRYPKNVTAEEKRQAELAAYAADFYLLSANAITEHGEIYEVDGTSNRISALCYGPKNVIIVAGYNKIVPNLREAVIRVKRIAAPANTMRLCTESFCEKTGICIAPKCDTDHLMCGSDCGEHTICSNTLILSRQSARTSGRITVIIVGEELGY